MTQTDEALMEEVRCGQVGRLAALFERHHRGLFNYFYRLTGDRAQSEDLVQDVFFRILRFRETYQLRNSFAPWMYQVARNAHMDGIRKRKNEADWGEDRPEPASNEPHAEEQLWREQEVELLRKALAALPERQREVLVLSRFQNLKYEEIGGIARLPGGILPGPADLGGDGAYPGRGARPGRSRPLLPGRVYLRKK